MNQEPGTRNRNLIILGLFVLVAGLFLGKALSGPAFTPATFAHKYYFYGFPVDSLKACEKRFPGQALLIAEAVSLYSTKNFLALSPILEKLSQQQPEARVFPFYAGLTAHYLKDRDAALAVLLPLSETAGTFQQPARWYAALTYVLFNESENAIELLKKIMDGPYQNKARELWADLE